MKGIKYAIIGSIMVLCGAAAGITTHLCAADEKAQLTFSGISAVLLGFGYIAVAIFKKD